MLEWGSRYQLFSSKFPRCLAMFENHCTNGTPSSTLAWKIPWTEEPGGLQSMASLGVNTTERLHFHFSLSCIGEGNGNPLQCSCLETPKDGLAWWAAVCGVARSRTRLKRLSSSSSTLLYGPTLTSVHDYWENHSLDWMDLCWQSDVEMYLSLQQVL